jgi:hypothetical protein
LEFWAKATNGEKIRQSKPKRDTPTSMAGVDSMRAWENALPPSSRLAAQMAKRLENLLLRLRAYIPRLQDYPCCLQITEFS